MKREGFQAIFNEVGFFAWRVLWCACQSIFEPEVIHVVLAHHVESTTRLTDEAWLTYLPTGGLCSLTVHVNNVFIHNK